MNCRKYGVVGLGVLLLGAAGLGRFVWMPSASANPSESAMECAVPPGLSVDQRRYLSNQPRHWRDIAYRQ